MLYEVYEALKEKDTILSISSLVIFYPGSCFITSHKNARSTILRLERDELLEELVNAYLHRKLEKEG